MHPETDGSHAYHLDTAILNSLASATYAADAIRRHGAIPSLELSHSGMYAGTCMTDKNRQHGMNQWGPSDTIRPDGVEVKALTEERIQDIVAAYGNAAGLAKRAGCECAIHLGMEGKTVHLVEMRDALAPDANVRHRPLLLKEIEKYVTVHTNYRGLEVTAEGVWCPDEFGNRQFVPGTSVICALGQRSRTDAVEDLRDAAPYVAVIGDASRVSTITNAVYWGYHAALDI